MTAEAAPAWLVSWRERGPAPLAQPRQQHGQGGSGERTPVSAVAEAQRPARPQANGYGFIEPEPWPCDDGTRREAVLDMDHHPPRVVRTVGWQRCIRCRSQFFSEDVIAVRLCGKCKEPERDRRKPLRLLKDGHPA